MIKLRGCLLQREPFATLVRDQGAGRRRGGATGVVRTGGGWCESRRPRACRAPYPARAGGPWLCRTLVLFLFHAVVVPSGFTISVQPQR